MINSFKNLVLTNTRATIDTNYLAGDKLRIIAGQEQGRFCNVFGHSDHMEWNIICESCYSCFRCAIQYFCLHQTW